jgi:hypothetical protein
MENRFKNGYTCKACLKEGKGGYRFNQEPLTPLYYRIDKKFKFAGLVKCDKHGITEAIALREL